MEKYRNCSWQHTYIPDGMARLQREELKVTTASPVVVAYGNGFPHFFKEDDDMDSMTNISGTSAAYTSTAVEAKKSEAKPAEEKREQTVAEKIGSQPAAVYERSDAADAAKDKVKRTDADRAAFIKQAQADLEARQQQLTDIVSKMMGKQGQTVGLADDMWKMLADGKFEVDAATKAQAQEDISEDGYWGVEKTSDRIVDFAKALAGDDPEKADKMIEAFKKGYEQATKAWGKDLPDISKNTYDSTIKKLEDWRDGKENQTQPVDETQA